MSWTPPVDPAFDLEARLQEFDERMKRDKVRAATRRRRIARLRDAHAGTAQTPREAPVGPQAAGEAAQEGDFCGWPPLLIEDLWHGPVCTVPWERCAVCNLEGLPGGPLAEERPAVRHLRRHGLRDPQLRPVLATQAPAWARAHRAAEVRGADGEGPRASQGQEEAACMTWDGGVGWAARDGALERPARTRHRRCLMPAYRSIPPPVPALWRRFASKVIVEPDSGCWLWTGALSTKGYGLMDILGALLRTHRIAYSWLVGPIPAGLTLDHLCRVRRCCNPDHLEAVAHRTNYHRGEAANAVIARSGACVRGHGPEHRRWRKDRPGRWDCRECGRERQRAFAARRGA